MVPAARALGVQPRQDHPRDQATQKEGPYPHTKSATKHRGIAIDWLLDEPRSYSRNRSGDQPDPKGTNHAAIPLGMRLLESRDLGAEDRVIV
jgi:hypothetical protein